MATDANDTAPDSLLTIPEVADELGYHRQSIYRWIRAGDLPASRLTPSSHWRVKRSDLDAFIRSAETTLDPVA